ncbi:MAG: O-antigen ligase family protein [Chloroflexota bacterium]|nr:O-antigen ligase family protein [Chloroflexota bacterium]
MTPTVRLSAASIRIQESSLLDRLPFGLLLLVAATLPFEIIQYRLTFPWFEWTNLELLVSATILGWVLHSLFSGRLFNSKATLTENKLALRWLLTPALLWLFLALLSAVLAPTHRVEALKFVTRFANGLFVFFLIISIVTTRRRLIALLWALVVGTGLSALLGMVEVAEWAIASPLLALFKDAPTFVGGELRASASFPYATTAAMFYEMVIPLALVLVAVTQRAAARVAALLVALLCTTAVVLTLTRTGMVTILLLFLVMLILSLVQRRFRPLTAPVGIPLLTLLSIVGLFALQSNTFRTRFTTENDISWYDATYLVPPTIELDTDGETPITIEVRNTGKAAWHASGEHAYALGYRWMSEDGQHALQLPRRTFSLPTDVLPGESAQVSAVIQSDLPPGAYRIAWSMLQHDILWFHHRGVAEGETVVHIPDEESSRPASPPPPTPSVETTEALPQFPTTVGRRDLWQAALLMWRERPFLGVGPDNFRHLYGSYIGLAQWDTRIYANNLYLELLATLGLLGILAFGWLLLTAARPLLRILRNQQGGYLVLLAVGIAGSLLAFLLHGLLDYFLGVTSIATLFWVVLGLGVVVAHWQEGARESGC